VRRQQRDCRVHFVERPSAALEELLPARALRDLGTDGGARAEIGIGPQVADLIGLTRLGRPQGDYRGIFLGDLGRPGEIQPLAGRRPAGRGA
jgi:hypothetical protein